MSEETRLISLAAIFVLGIGAQWVSWRLKVPSILILLATGFLAGSVAELVDPDDMFGHTLFPLVSLSVGLIMFEGGLSLRLRELQHIGPALWKLLTIGVIITWILTTLAAWILLPDLSNKAKILLGAILVVTGPTVIGPLLKHIRPIGNVGPMARWEGIIIDPIGAILAVIVFEMHSKLSLQEPVLSIAGDALAILGKTILIGGGLGAVGAILLIVLFHRYLVPDALQNPVVLTMVVAVFAAANVMQDESGLVAVTVMGIILANQKVFVIKHIIEFKENITILLLSSLFILLAANVEKEDLAKMDIGEFVFAAVLILIVRPVAVFVSTFRSGLKWQEKVLLSWLAPRGIVAAAVAALFAIRLQQEGLVEKSYGLTAVTFLVIVTTVVVYGLTAPWLARKLGLSVVNPQGILFASAHAGARAVALELQKAKVPVVLVDTNWEHVQTAKLEGLRAYFVSILANDLAEEIDLANIGRFLALTANDEVNSLASWQMGEQFGSKEVYQLVPEPRQFKHTHMSKEHLHGRLLFADNATYNELDRRFALGSVVKRTTLGKEFGMEEYLQEYGESALPMFVINPTGIVTVCTADKPATPVEGDTLISLVFPPEKKEPEPSSEE